MKVDEAVRLLDLVNTATERLEPTVDGPMSESERLGLIGLVTDSMERMGELLGHLSERRPGHVAAPDS